MVVMLLESMAAPILESLWLEYDFWHFHLTFVAPQMAGTFGPSKFPQLQYLTLPGMQLSFCTDLGTVFPNITHLHLPSASFEGPTF